MHLRVFYAIKYSLTYLLTYSKCGRSPKQSWWNHEDNGGNDLWNRWVSVRS